MCTSFHFVLEYLHALDQHHRDVSSHHWIRPRCIQLLQGTVSPTRLSPLSSRLQLSRLRIRHHLCGFDLNLTYPQVGTFPTLNLTSGLRATLGADGTSSRAAASLKAAFANELAARKRTSRNSPGVSERLRKRSEWKRDLSGRANGTIDPWYGCDVFDEMRDYALNFTFPWCKRRHSTVRLSYVDIHL